MEQTAYLVLENGKVFKGKNFGYAGEAVGELVFTTAMTGYLETLTDPSYYGQTVVQTFPLIGNYGVIPQDFESKAPALCAYIVKEWCQEPSNFRSAGVLDTFLKQNKIPGFYGIDTRALTRIVREYGVMNAKITFNADNVDEIVKELKEYTVKNAVQSVTAQQLTVQTPKNTKYKVALWDFGAKENIRRELLKRDCEVINIPANYTAEQIINTHPDGIMLSNGPGDPAENTEIIKQLAILCEAKIPTFGICLGHQLMALAQGATTKKLKYGHRGANQPVKNLDTGRVYITSQNHGYAVKASTLPVTARESFVNANDGTCEGVRYTNMPAFTVQFHPEAAAGPQDTAFLFDTFLNMIKEGKADAVK